jgi:hypothetical protein
VLDAASPPKPREEMVDSVMVEEVVVNRALPVSLHVAPSKANVTVEFFGRKH